MENIVNGKPIKHEVTLCERASGNVAGVTKVLSVNPSKIVLSTPLGELEISGSDLKINGFNQVEHSFSFSGKVDCLTYQKQKEPLLKKLFK